MKKYYLVKVLYNGDCVRTELVSKDLGHPSEQNTAHTEYIIICDVEIHGDRLSMLEDNYRGTD